MLPSHVMMAPPPDPDAALVHAVRSLMTRFGFTQLDVMRDSGVSNSVLCLWLRRRYKGDNAKVAARMTNWLATIERREEERSRRDREARAAERAAAAAASGEEHPAAAAAAVPGTAASSAPPVPLYASAHPSSFGHGKSGKRSQHVQHEHLVPIRLWHTLPVPGQQEAAASGPGPGPPPQPKQGEQQPASAAAAAASAAAASSASAATTAAAATAEPAAAAASRPPAHYSDCFLWNLFDAQLPPRTFLTQTLLDQGMDVSVWLQPLLAQMSAQLAHYAATEPIRPRDREEWAQVLAQHVGNHTIGVDSAASAPGRQETHSTPVLSHHRMAPVEPARAVSAGVASTSAAAASTATSSARHRDATLRELAEDMRTPAAVTAALEAQPERLRGGGTLPRRPGQPLPAFVCAAVSSVPLAANYLPFNTMTPRRGGDAMDWRQEQEQEEPEAESSSSSSEDEEADRRTPAGPAAQPDERRSYLHRPGTGEGPDLSLLHQDPAGPSSRQSAPQLLHLKLDVADPGSATRLRYQLLWDSSSPACIPEDFARTLCAELGLSGEVCALLAWQVRALLARDAELLAQGVPEGCLGRVPFAYDQEELFRTPDAPATRAFEPRLEKISRGDLEGLNTDVTAFVRGYVPGAGEPEAKKAAQASAAATATAAATSSAGRLAAMRAAPAAAASNTQPTVVLSPPSGASGGAGAPSKRRRKSTPAAWPPPLSPAPMVLANAAAQAQMMDTSSMPAPQQQTSSQQQQGRKRKHVASAAARQSTTQGQWLNTHLHAPIYHGQSMQASPVGALNSALSLGGHAVSSRSLLSPPHALLPALYPLSSPSSAAAAGAYPLLGGLQASPHGSPPYPGLSPSPPLTPSWSTSALPTPYLMHGGSSGSSSSAGLLSTAGGSASTSPMPITMATQAIAVSPQPGGPVWMHSQQQQQSTVQQQLQYQHQLQQLQQQQQQATAAPASATAAAAAPTATAAATAAAVPFLARVSVAQPIAVHPVAWRPAVRQPDVVGCARAACATAGAHRGAREPGAAAGGDGSGRGAATSVPPISPVTAMSGRKNRTVHAVGLHMKPPLHRKSELLVRFIRA